MGPNGNISLLGLYYNLVSSRYMGSCNLCTHILQGYITDSVVTDYPNASDLTLKDMGKMILQHHIKIKTKWSVKPCAYLMGCTVLQWNFVTTQSNIRWLNQ